MAKVKYTKEQQLAIDTIDRSVLVSAAAGSGKTAVLIERIIGIILKGEADVDQMLIVSFTNAAAAEMRVKLQKALKKEIGLHPENRARLREQLDKLYRAYITTFNSFAIRIIREFFYEVDIEPSFTVCDEVESTMMQATAIDQLFEEAFEKDDIIPGASFRGFLRLYSGDRSEDEIKSKLIKAYTKLRTMPNYFEWARAKVSDCEAAADTFSGSNLEHYLCEDCKAMLQSVLFGISEIKTIYEDAGLKDLYARNLESEENSLSAIYGLIADKDKLDKEICDALLDFEFARINAGKNDEKDAYNSIKDDVKELRDSYKGIFNSWVVKFISPDIETRLQEMKDSTKETSYFLSLLEAFEQRYKELKKEKGLLDFSDMEHTAAKILSKPEISDIMRKRFKYIFIDEYQDTNNIQEHLITQVSRKDNVFMVGDVKQSIYRFRQAEPAIFERTYKEYSEDGNNLATAIDLNMNFRSNANTIKYINVVFDNIMEGYDEKAALKPCPLSENDNFDYKPELHILIDDRDSDAKGQSGEAAVASEAVATIEISPEMIGENVEDAIEDLSRQEAEAKYIAGIIQDLIGTEYYDTVLGKTQKAEPRDIVILLRAISNRGETFARELRNLNIQSHIVEEESFFDATEIRVMLSLLSTIDNARRDVPLIASLHSEVWGFGASELALVRAEAEGRVPYYEALSQYIEKGSDRELASRLSAAVEQIESWRNLATMMSLPDFIWKVLTESGYYLFAGAMYDGSRRQANLRALVDRAVKYTENYIASLSDFLRYLEVMRTKKCKSGQASMVSKDDNLVQITTIHKSKGLEYPFVIVAGIGNRLNHDNLSKGANFDSQLGIFLPYVSPDKKYWRSTIMQQLIHQKNRSEEDEEELRILYVAMTRARNKLVLVGSLKNEENLYKKYRTPSNYLEIMRDVLSSPYNDTYIKTLERYVPIYEKSGLKTIIASKDEKLSDAAENNYKEVARRLSYEYPYKDELAIKAKFSVSELRLKANQEEKERKAARVATIASAVAGANAALNDADQDALPKPKTRARIVSSAELGTAYHRIMEFADFARANDASYIKETADILRANGAIDDAVYEKLDLDRISAFFETAIGRRAVAAAEKGLLKKEKAFTLNKELDGNRILVQGIIDCCFEEDGEYILLDYKSSYRTIDDIKTKYKAQLDLYREAISKGTGKAVKEAYLYSFELGEAVNM